MTRRGTRQPKHPILTKCKLPVVCAGDTALSCPGVTSKPCPCWGSHQTGLATSKDLQPPACAGGRIWGPLWGHRCQDGPVPPPLLGVWRGGGSASWGSEEGTQAGTGQRGEGVAGPVDSPLSHTGSACPGSPCSTFSWPWTVWRLSRMALTLQPLFAKGLSPHVSPGAQGHRLSQCQVSPEDPPQIGVFLHEVLLWGRRSSVFKLGL